MTEFATVLVSAGSHEEARRIARELVDRRLAACVQLLPVESIYCWEGAIEEAREHLLLIKTRAADFAEVEAAILPIHSYDVPEIISLPIQAGSRPYLDWLTASLDRLTRS